MDDDIEMQFARTMAIIRQMADGKYLELSGGYKIAMGDDLSIGFLIEVADCEPFVSGDMSIKDLNKICNDNRVSFPIPAKEACKV